MILDNDENINTILNNSKFNVIFEREEIKNLIAESKGWWEMGQSDFFSNINSGTK